jgi:eukaryotic-like serine/threonine-protein kinase
MMKSMSGIPAGAGQLLGKRLGKFEILALLALGGTAEIYLARIGGAAGFEKYVVVKCLHDHLADDAEFVKMFLDEARLAAHLDHSNIVQTMELGQYEGRYYMVMEFLAGLSLAMVVRRVSERLPDTRIPVPLVLNVLAQSCAGLHYAHEKAMNGKPLNIVHRDISPQNLVVSFEGVVKLVDFGIAKAEMRETRTRSGTIKGKFAYMSPEQCVANNVDRRTDVFALGVIGHELLTGRRLFKRPSPYETYQSVMECDVKPPSAINGAGDPALDQVILRALTRDKEERYPTAEAFGDALLGYLHHRGIGSGPGDVARFFEAYFGQEIEEHSGRMRELIAGRDIAMTAGVSWGGEEPDDDARRERDADSALRHAVARTIGAPAGPLGESIEPGEPGLLGGMFDDLGAGSRGEDDDEMPAERTRIETNPLERVNELERLAARTPRPSRKAGSGKSAPPGTRAPGTQPPGTQAPGTQAPGAAGVGAASPGATPGAPGKPSSGRFPDLANLPTMIAENAPALGAPPPVATFANAPISPAPGAPNSFTNGPPAASAPSASDFADVPTTLTPGNMEPGSYASSPTLSPDNSPGVVPASLPLGGPGSYASAPTLPPNTMAPGSYASSPTLSPDNAPGVVPESLPLGGPRFANAQTMLAPGNLGSLGSSPGSSPAVPVMPMSYPRPEVNGEAGVPRPGSPSSPPNMHPAIPAGYPVMNAELSAQMAAGASVFPSEHHGPGPRPAGPDSGPQPHDRGQFPHDGASYPQDRGQFPQDRGQFPQDRGQFPQDRGQFPHDGGQFPHDGASYPHDGGQFPHDGASYPQDSGQFPHDGASYPQDSGPFAHDGGQFLRDSAPFPRDGASMDPQRAAQVMSPVGQHYPAQVDWDAAAAAPAKAVPAWLLAILFVAALGLALGLTVVVARLLG